ncbi:MAG TPA: hypothetical protein VK858_12635 [Longimicrobiales bacterium]|nr:hypothetical protein [Longimicrobiales bacterium]
MHRSARSTSRGRLAAALVLLLVAAPRSTVAQAADPADVGSVDAIITALYDVISGPMGEARDQERFRSLFTADARLIPTNAQAPGGYVALTPDEYWARSADQLAAIGFTEAEIGRTTETFGLVTHAFSTYESYREDRGDTGRPFARGINSIQILEAGDRFWIMSVMWDSERPGNEIPDRYIGGR